MQDGYSTESQISNLSRINYSKIGYKIDLYELALTI